MRSTYKSGMQGVFLTAAELTHRDFVVSPTSRNAPSADLLVTDFLCKRTWSVQVKTNQSTSANFWLLNASAEKLVSDNLIYVFVALRGNQRPKFLVVPSRIVVASVCKQSAQSGTFYSFARDTKFEHKDEGWEEAFGEPTRPLAEQITAADSPSGH